MAFLLENIMVMYRRVMIGCMIDPVASILAVILMALEEVIFRSTMVYRDNFFDWLRGRREATGPELEYKVEILPARTTSATLKVCSIETNSKIPAYCLSLGSKECGQPARP